MNVRITMSEEQGCFFIDSLLPCQFRNDFLKVAINKKRSPLQKRGCKNVAAKKWPNFPSECEQLFCHSKLQTNNLFKKKLLGKSEKRKRALK